MQMTNRGYLHDDVIFVISIHPFGRFATCEKVVVPLMANKMHRLGWFVYTQRVQRAELLTHSNGDSLPLIRCFVFLFYNTVMTSGDAYTVQYIVIRRPNEGADPRLLSRRIQINVPTVIGYSVMTKTARRLIQDSRELDFLETASSTNYFSRL